MKILLKLINPNANGANGTAEFKTVKDAEKYLNEALYYSTRVELSSSFNDLVEYDNNTSLSELMRDAVNYGEGYINVYQIFE